MPTNNYTTPGADTHTWKDGVTKADVECYGGGVTGGDGPGDGGGGGAYAFKADVARTGATDDVYVANPGEDSWFVSDSTVLAKGGAGTNGGSSGASIGDTVFSGGNGEPAGVDDGGGGGGGGGRGDINNGTGGAGARGEVIVTTVAGHLDFDVQPSNTDEDTVISPSVTVRILDVDNAVDTAATGNITVAIGTNPSAGTLSGTVVRAAVAGVATFDDLEIDNDGSGYTLVASHADCTGDTSDSFDIIDTDPPVVVTGGGMMLLGV